jgi:pyridoxal phosphate enzyme (YggS family)
VEAALGISTALREVRARIAAAAARAGRDPSGVRLIGVVKTVGVDRIRAAVDAGLEDLGENRVQEAAVAVEAVGRNRARWHMIGHLQRNKAGRAVTLFDRVHGIDGVELAETLSNRAAASGIRVPVLIQVNAESEGTKHGVAPDAVSELVGRVAALPGLSLDGLMSIGPPVETPEASRPYFARVRDIRDRAQRETGVRLPELSMGMSGDFEVAIEEGSTMVRVGTALFGDRPAPRSEGGGECS